jgi:hypothetical protein
MLRNSQSIPATARRTQQNPPPQRRSSRCGLFLMCILILASCFAASVTVMALPIHSQQLTTLGQQPDDPLASAHKLADEQKYPEAEAQVRAYLEGHLLSAEAHFLLGFILFRENKAKESLAEYTAGARYKSPSAADLKIVAFDYVLTTTRGRREVAHRIDPARSRERGFLVQSRPRPVQAQPLPAGHHSV